VDKAKALETFQTRAAKLQAAGIEGVDPENRPLVEASLLDNVGRARRSVAGLVAARDKADIMSGGMAYFEEMQRFAARASKNILTVYFFRDLTNKQTNQMRLWFSINRNKNRKQKISLFPWLD
jgi:hypothetical protein